MNYKIIKILGTGFGTGYFPVAPGTAASLAALILFILFPLSDLAWLIICAVVFFSGIPIGSSIESESGKDPSEVVIDEFVGQWVSLLFLPHQFIVFIGGFVLFRIFDILKPFPVNISQELKGGLGIMIDDILAGIYANLSLQLIIYFFSEA